MAGVPTYDIEAIDWVKAIAVGFYDGENYHEFVKMKEEDDPVGDFLDFIGSNFPGIKVCAHNAAKYDAKFILAKLQERKHPVRMESGLFRLTWLKTRVTFEDSYVSLPGALRDLCASFGVSDKLQWDHDDTEYPWVMKPNDYSNFRAYLKRDCISLSEVMEKYCELMLSKYHIVPSLTLALTAAKAFDKNFYAVNQIHPNEEYERFIRLATYGGRNEIYKMYGEGLNFYDIKQAYVACYNAPVPISKLLWTVPNLDRGSMAYAKVKIPKQAYIGPLPYRVRGQERFLAFPVGEIEGWWDVVDLRFAVEQGCDLKIIKQLEADEEPIMKEFGDYVYELRQSAKDEVESRIWKLFGSRLVGKLGQSRWRSKIVHADGITDYTNSVPLDDMEEYHEFIEYVKGSRAPYIKPAVNMRIRAEARVRHARMLLEAMKYGNIFYCDTDSVTTNTEMHTGTGLGELKLLHRALRGYFIQCKFYGWVSDLGILHQVSAGFSDFKLGEYDFQNLLTVGTEIEQKYSSLSSWRDTLKHGLVNTVPHKRTVVSALNFKNRRRDGVETFPLIMSP